VPQSADGSIYGEPRDIGTFRTPPSQRPPRPLDGLAISSVVGADRFTVEQVGQDKPGFAYVIVTRPNNQLSKVSRNRWSSEAC
jgi:hypothetical protein